MVAPKITGDKFISSMRKFFFTVILRQTEESGSKKSTSNASPEPTDHHHQQQPQDHQAYEIQQEPSDQIVVEDNGGEDGPEYEPMPPNSEWVISIEKKIQQACQDNKARSRTKHSMYRIPHNLKNGKDKAYIPQMVSIGPYHHYKEHLHQMNQHKWRCLDHVLKRTNKKITLYLDSMMKLEKSARTCYEWKIVMTSEEFVEMMVLDGCFVVELLRGCNEDWPKLGYPSDDPVFSMQGLMHIIQRDMIMLENQIPLFILDKLLGLQINDPDQTGLVAKMAHGFFEPLKPTDVPPVNPRTRLEYELGTFQDKFHCLEVFRESLLHPGPQPVETKGSSQGRHELIHCVMDLRKAGIKFRKRKTDTFWDIQFKDGILQIPPLVIHDGTRSLFLNLIAFEQCHYHVNFGNAITSYVIFMDNLINSPEDVGHLHDHGIIKHWLGSDAEVADLFNQICKEVVFDINHSYLSKLSEEVNSYSHHKWNGWIASLKLKYFSNPWSITSLIAAFFLLVLTFIQTFYGVYGYYKPGS